MPLGIFLLVVILLLVIGGVVPLHSWSAGWGYAPSGLVGLLIVVIVVLALLGRI
jgi:hypothetical protein